MSDDFAISTYRAKHRRRGQGCHEYRITDARGKIIAVCLTPEDARRVYTALVTPRAVEEEARRSMSGDEMWRDNNA